MPHTASRNNGTAHAVLFAFFYCIILAVIGLDSRSLLPVDETRYASVAWEMFSQKQWILPTLNFEPYHHKPPLLFWTIMGLWSVFGVSENVALIVPFLFALAVVLMTGRMAAAFFPTQPQISQHSILILLGTLIFPIYSNMLMFDLLLTVWVITGLFSGWRFTQTGKPLWILTLGISLGLGLLSKGPVILIHVAIPLIIFQFWSGIRQDQSITRGHFAVGLALAIAIGAVIVLSWALPAANLGGPDFREKIFWGQSAGRMVSSFDHGRPIWWYIAISPMFLMPWLIWPPLWRTASGMIKTRKAPQAFAPHEKRFLRFLASWIIPVFIVFSLISGKQPHYLLPLLPALSIGLAYLFSRVETVKKKDYIAITAFLTFIGAIPFLLSLLPMVHAGWEDKPHLMDTFDRISGKMALVFCFLILSSMLYASRKQSVTTMLWGVAVATFLAVGVFLMQGRESFFPNYDLRPMAKVIAKDYPENPLAFLRNYHGEFSFLSRLNRPVKQLEPQYLDQWFSENPNGIALVRTDSVKDIADYDILFQRPYKMTKIYAIIAPKGRERYPRPR